MRTRLARFARTLTSGPTVTVTVPTATEWGSPVLPHAPCFIGGPTAAQRMADDLGLMIPGAVWLSPDSVRDILARRRALRFAL